MSTERKLSTAKESKKWRKEVLLSNISQVQEAFFSFLP
jgi:hypothetical protein